MTVALSSIRIDVPTTATAAEHFFVGPQSARWGAWWGELFAHLTAFLPTSADWELDHAQNVLFHRRLLSESETYKLARYLGGAPEDDRRDHRGLRRAILRMAEPGTQATLVFFRARVP
jgi:hypothetical protein